MSFLSRLLEALDDNLHTDAPEIPEQRLSPDLEAEQLPPARRFEIAGFWSHCPCCTAHTPPPCPLLHRLPCDSPGCVTV